MTQLCDMPYNGLRSFNLKTKMETGTSQFFYGEVIGISVSVIPQWVDRNLDI